MWKKFGSDAKFVSKKKKNDWTLSPNPVDTKRILERCETLVPGISKAKILGQFVGLRPARKGGVRLESTPIQNSKRKGTLIYNYGHGGSGMTLSFGYVMLTRLSGFLNTIFKLCKTCFGTCKDCFNTSKTMIEAKFSL